MKSVHRAAVLFLVPALSLSIIAASAATPKPASGAATQPPASTPKPATPAGSGPPPLSKLVMDGNGHIKESVRKSVKDSDIILRVNWPYMAGGPHASTFYSLGQQDVDPLMIAAHLKGVPYDFMYMGIPADQPAAKKGVRYAGQELDGKLPLLVTADNPCCFTVSDEARTRPGSAVFGVFQDGAGEIWIYQESLGSYFTDASKFISMHMDKMATVTQAAFKAEFNLFLSMHPPASRGAGGGGAGAPCPSKYASSYTVGVNRHVDTGIRLAKGDKFTIRASGEVTFGIMAGSGGPEGIDFLPAYNYFAENKHGCLIGRIRGSDDDPWFYVGAGGDFIADRTGELQFNVNDNDPDNNVGEFKVEITVCKQR